MFPDYICYNDKLCDDNLFSILLHSPIDLFDNNNICRSLNKYALKNENINEWTDGMDYFYKLFHKCLNDYQPLLISNSSDLYQCINSSKIISQYRLLDGIEDCLYGDDELYNESCSLKHFNHRFKCDQDINTKCLVRTRVYDKYIDCLDGSDEPRKLIEIFNTTISFQTICDGFIELIPIMIDGQNETDETECNYFSCNNIYTRCDGFWNCPDGIDEINCEWPSICPPYHHMCISPIFGNITCLPIQRINDGVIDCLGSSDERQYCRDIYISRPAFRYQCSNSGECISVTVACLHPVFCPDDTNIPIYFCQNLNDVIVRQLWFWDKSYSYATVNSYFHGFKKANQRALLTYWFYILCITKHTA